MRGERLLLAQIGACPSDDALRLVYADWLTDEGSAGSLAKAAFLRAQATRASLRQTAPVPPDWLARVDRTSIENCPLPRERRHYCPRDWQELLPRSGDGRIRFCAECSREVHHCATEPEVEERLAEGLCVAVSSRLRSEGSEIEVVKE